MYKRKVKEKQLILKRATKKYFTEDGKIRWVSFGGVSGSCWDEERGFFKPRYTYNSTDIRKNCNATTRAKIKQSIKEVNLEDSEDLILPQNGDYQKLTDYEYTIF